MHRSLAPLALGLALALAGCPGSTPPAPTRRVVVASSQGEPPSGQKAFQATCSACHGPDGKGLPNLGKDLTISTFVKAQTDDQLLAFVKAGRAVDDPANTTHVAMPPKGGNPALKDEDIRAIITHIRGLQTAAH